MEPSFDFREKIPSNKLSGELLSAENVEMKMENGLVGIRAAVGDYAIAALKTCVSGDLGDSLEDLCNVE